MGNIVDTKTAIEFMKETMEKIRPGSLEETVDLLREKSRRFQDALGSTEAVRTLSTAQLKQLTSMIFAMRRRNQWIKEPEKVEAFRHALQALLYDRQPVSDRVDAFVQRIPWISPRLRVEIASEFLHYVFPDQYWLWTRWIWDEKTSTGALPLVTTENYVVEGRTPGEKYTSIGKGIAFVHEVGDAAGFQTISRDLFGTHVFLSCVYVIYAYTVLRMRMTQEFNQVMPTMTEFTRRLLGVQHLTNTAMSN